MITVCRLKLYRENNKDANCVAVTRKTKKKVDDNNNNNNHNHHNNNDDDNDADDDVDDDDDDEVSCVCKCCVNQDHIKIKQPF